MGEELAVSPRQDGGLRRIWNWIRQNVLRLAPDPIRARGIARRAVELTVSPAAEATTTDPQSPADDEIILLEPVQAVVREDRGHQRAGGAVLGSIRQGLAEVPPLPHVVRELLRELADPESSARSVARIASSDPALAATLIRTVNSAAMGLRRKVTSVQEAVSFLGYSNVRSLVIRMRLQYVLPVRAGQNAYDAEDLWVHSLAVAYAAEALAQRLPQMDRGLIGTLGLLHDIGKLAINSYFPQSADEIRHGSPEHPEENFLERERRILGADHAEIGAMLAQHWKLPPDLVEAIRWHHAPEHAPAALPESLRQTIIVVHVANQIAKYCYVYSDDMEIDIVPDTLLRQAGLPGPMFRLMGTTTRRAVSRAIFFADESSTQPLAAIRRFLRLSGKAPQHAPVAPESADPWRASGPRLGWLDDGWEQQLSRDPTRIDCTLLSTQRMDAALRSVGQHAKFVARVVPGTVDRMLQASSKHLDSLNLEESATLPAKFVIRRLVPNLAEIAPGERVEVYTCQEGQVLLTAISSPAMAFARRLGADVEPRSAKAILQGELANVLNLRWFRRIGVSEDGTTIMFVSHKDPERGRQG